MNEYYDLIDDESGNLLGSYETLTDALQVVRRIADRGDRPMIDRLSLIHGDNADTQELIAAGPALADLAYDRAIA